MKVKLMPEGRIIEAKIKKASAEENSRWGFVKMAHWMDEKGMACSVPVQKTEGGYVEIYTISRAASAFWRMGGSVKSEKKTAAARANAMKGGRKHPDRKTYWIASGEGERGKWNKHIVTLAGAKRIATRERCGGDRWARIYEEIPETETTRAYIIEIDGDDIRDVPTV